MNEEEKDLAEQKEKDRVALQAALAKLYDQGPSTDQPYGDPVVLFRQLAPFTRRWLQHLDEDDTKTLGTFAKQHQAFSTAWRSARKIVAWMGATVLATLAFGEQALRFFERARDYLW
jgi:hypothetical protein